MAMIAHDVWMSVSPPYDYLEVAFRQTRLGVQKTIQEWIDENTSGWVYASSNVSQFLEPDGIGSLRYYFEIEADLVLTAMWLQSDGKDILRP